MTQLSLQNREDLVVAAREGDVNVFRSEFDF